ncbi:MAG: A/G-specific adenine glycosylase [bacterium]
MERINNVPELLLQWGLPQLRNMPWRETQDPWHVLVSEVMLQQTHVPRVLPRFERFVALFPTPRACAAASLADMLVEWQGMGYPRRCKNLQLAAQMMVDRFDGEVPQTLNELLELPGVGPYTARAVLTFALDADVAVVDTNVARVLARISGKVLNARASQEMADAWLPIGFSRDWNQVIMDFGATVCTARKAHCEGCPVFAQCVWKGGVGNEMDPAKTSAFTSKPQAKFAGSDRQARGKLMKALTVSGVTQERLAAVMEIADAERAVRLAQALVKEGLVEYSSQVYQLPSTMQTTMQR